jgi:ribonuclease P protein component
VALKRAFRLRSSSDFQRVRQQGRSLSSRLLILAWRPNDLTQQRVGFVISKRISKLAVRRNYLKRLLGEAVRSQLGSILPGYDVVLTARHTALEADLPALAADILVLLRRARLLIPGEPKRLDSGPSGQG